MGATTEASSVKIFSCFLMCRVATRIRPALGVSWILKDLVLETLMLLTFQESKQNCYNSVAIWRIAKFVSFDSLRYFFRCFIGLGAKQKPKVRMLSFTTSMVKSGLWNMILFGDANRGLIVSRVIVPVYHTGTKLNFRAKKVW